MGNVEIFEKFLLEEPKREQLFPLFEEVFGITIQTLNDFLASHYFPVLIRITCDLDLWPRP